MAALLAALLDLPNEILLCIIRLACEAASAPTHRQVAILRLVCRHLRDACSHLLLSRTTVDVSRPETLERLCGISNNRTLALGVREVNVRLHFYHSWIASSFENFAAAIISEWTQRRQRWWPVNYKKTGQLAFQDIVCRFLDELQALPPNEVCDEEADGEEAGIKHPAWPCKVVREAFQVYRTKSAAQQDMLQTVNFARAVATAFSKFPNATHLVLYDGDLTNNYDPGTLVRVDSDDVQGQEHALVQILSRPMLWEEARWILPIEKVWPGVPVELLRDIPAEIGSLDGVFLHQLSLNVSSAPDYTSLATEPERLLKLSTAVGSMSLFQVSFHPRCRSGCGPWAVDENMEPIYAMRSSEEIKAINQYLGALINTKSMYHVDINLGEFWLSAGLESIRDAPASLGIDFPWPDESELASVSLHAVSLASTDLKRLTSALCREATVELTSIFLRDGTWSSALDTLRGGLDAPQDIKIRHPMGGGIDDLSNEHLSFLFDDSGCGRSSRVERFVKGEDTSNPFRLLIQ